MVVTKATLEDLLFRGEPDWLRDRRREALESYERLPMPSKTDEEWRRTDVSRFDPAEYAELEHDSNRCPSPPTLTRISSHRSCSHF